MILMTAAGTHAEIADKTAHVGPLGDGCFTQIMYELNNPVDKSDGRCPAYGICDDPDVRNTWIPAVDDPIKVVRVYFNVFTDDNGSNPAISVEHLEEAMDAMNASYLGLRIQFAYDYRMVAVISIWLSFFTLLNRSRSAMSLSVLYTMVVLIFRTAVSPGILTA